MFYSQAVLLYLVLYTFTFRRCRCYSFLWTSNITDIRKRVTYNLMSKCGWKCSYVHWTDPSIHVHTVILVYYLISIHVHYDFVSRTSFVRSPRIMSSMEVLQIWTKSTDRNLSYSRTQLRSYYRFIRIGINLRLHTSTNYPTCAHAALYWYILFKLLNTRYGLLWFWSRKRYIVGS